MQTEYQCPVFKWAELSSDISLLLSPESNLEVSYSEANAIINYLATWIKNNNFKRIAVISRNCEEFIYLVFASLRAQAMIIPLNFRLVEENWIEQLRLAAAEVLLVGEGFSLIDTLSIKQILFSELPFNKLSNEKIEHCVIKKEAEATVIFTSGSTGAGKGILLSAGNHFESAISSNQVTGLSRGDSWLLSLPMFHVGGHEILYRAAIAGAKIIVTEGSLSGEKFLCLVESTKPTHLSLVPTVLEEFVSTERGLKIIKSCKAILLGGAPSSHELREIIVKEKLPVLPSYGMTETCSHCTCVRKEDNSEKLFTSGKALPHTKIRILSPEGAELKSGDAGEIVLSGETIHQGVFLESGYKKRAGDWFFTGDLGVLDEDGYLSVIGRKDEMFISGGENIYPAEIENATRRLSGVSDCAVLVVDDEKWGKRPVLFVESDSADENKIQKHLSTAISKYKIPDKIFTLKALPRKGIGKVDREKLREMLKNAQ